MIDADKYLSYKNHAQYYAKPSTAFSDTVPRKQTALDRLRTIRCYAGNVMLITLFAGITAIICATTFVVISQLLQII